MSLAAETLAIVVVYNGRDDVVAAIAALRNEGLSVLIVDNGSSEETLALLKNLQESSGVTIDRLGVNRGIGFALNRGLSRARAEGFHWILTMDQDSIVQPGFMAAYSEAIRQDRQMVCLTPHIDTGIKRGRAGRAGSVSYAITSGNLVRSDVAELVGGFDEEMFIDCVDFDFSLRIRGAGYQINRVEQAHLKHRIGEPRKLSLFIRRLYVQHPPSRRYYMFRNYFYVAERHVTRFPRFVVKLGMLQLALLILAVTLDPRPMESLTAMGRGILDWIRRRRGPCRVIAA